jgi:hypothetical protein
VYIKETKRTDMINMVKGHFPFFPLAAAQGHLLVVLNLLKQ